MKLDLTPQLIEALKNAASINPNIVFRAGNVIKTVSNSQKTVAKFIVDVNIPKPFALLDLPKFLAILSLFKDNVTCYIKDNCLEIVGNGNYNISLLFASERHLVTAAKIADRGDIVITEEDTVAQTVLTQEIINNVMKIAATLGLPQIKILSMNGKLCIVVVDSKKGDSSNQMVYVIDENIDIGKLVYMFDIESFKMISDTYEVILSKKMFIKLKSANREYCITTSTPAKY